METRVSKITSTRNLMCESLSCCNSFEDLLYMIESMLLKTETSNFTSKKKEAIVFHTESKESQCLQV